MTSNVSELRAAVRSFARSVLPSFASDVERIPAPVPRVVVKQFADAGFLGIGLPESKAGRGRTLLEAAIVLEEIACLSPAVAFPVFQSSFGAIQAIAHLGPSDLRTELIPRVLAGEATLATAFNPASLRSNRNAEVTWTEDSGVLSGIVRLCLGAGYADGYLVLTRAARKSTAVRESAVYVSKGTSGLAFGKPHQLLGLRGVPCRDVLFQAVTVPSSHLLASGTNVDSLIHVLSLMQFGAAVVSTAIAQAAVEDLSMLLEDCEGVDGGWREAQRRLSEMEGKVASARSMLHGALENETSMSSCSHRSGLLCAAAIDTGQRVAFEAVQLAGAAGCNKSFPLEQRLRDSLTWGALALPLH